MGLWLLLCCQLWLLQIILLLCQVVSPNRLSDGLSGICSAFRSRVVEGAKKKLSSVKEKTKIEPKFLDRRFYVFLKLSNVFWAHPGLDSRVWSFRLMTSSNLNTYAFSSYRTHRCCFNPMFPTLPKPRKSR